MNDLRRWMDMVLCEGETVWHGSNEAFRNACHFFGRSLPAKPSAMTIYGDDGKQYVISQDDEFSLLSCSAWIMGFRPGRRWAACRASG